MNELINIYLGAGIDLHPANSKESSDTWLFSRFSTGWACGLHADWTELVSCVDSELEKAHGSSIQRR